MLKLKAFVHIVESPSSADLLDGRTEGRVLSEALRLAGIPYSYNLAVDKAALEESIGPRLDAAAKACGKLPILHLSMHGDEYGVGLTSGEHLHWDDLRTMLMPLMRKMNGGLLISMSSCFGASGCRMAMYSGNDPHFWALVGNTGNAAWADAAIAYVSFYHLFFKGIPLETCVHSMCVASGDTNFQHFDGAKTKAGWDAFVASNPPLIPSVPPLPAAATKV